MRERPIRLKAHEVRAILSGAKTQTRLVVKPQPPAGHNFAGFTTYSTHRADEGKAVWAAGEVRAALIDAHRVACPFGQPGDRLWVRETWADLTATHGRHWERKNPVTGLYERGIHPFLWYAADGDQPEMGGGEINREPWRPSTSMPRSACRLVLEITDVRVERLQTITDVDALAEGVDRTNTSIPGYAKERFRHLWPSTGGDWAANPWVWVISFRRLH
ncbi:MULTISPECIES: hypothetical protein [Xanthomonas]|uniref:hypothetical protein n=1 Tax=Xanthomonas TaxID=338 RepID=UPI0006E54071|nr:MULTISPECIES: hypothetical protein [Xanthomonas]MBO9790472.1 hypothetical protein [Xanthomonas phaseoli pv. dieffenbachiae]MBO9847978.1 hypothetical protein [Xanthomonas phaseoli pv. dieffenbachiae]OQP37325.1 hypothetical protein IB62_016515 [Xanthomonas euvesicatoria]